MRILHYSLGLPPYRSGGLTKYSCDLMNQQSADGDEIFLLFPGVMKFTNKDVSINHYKKHNNINVYELVNPLPVPLLNGISSPKEFMKKCEKNVFINFLRNNKIDIVHIHTLMGLYKEFLQVCNELGIKTVYTTHDYFGWCTKVNFIDNAGNLCTDIDWNKCVQCNSLGYSMKTINILQSKTYRFIKNNGGIDKLKKIKSKVKPKTMNNSHHESSNTINIIKDEDIRVYRLLKEYYREMFSEIDFFIFNSSITKEIFSKYIDCVGEIVCITHKDIKDNREKKEYRSKELKLTYLGPDKEYKGFFLLRNTMKEIYTEGYTDIRLSVFGDISSNNYGENILVHGKYMYNQLQSIFKETDVLIVPSIWNETFGFITLEALSYGVPVIASNTVGSKDIILGNNKGLVIEPTLEELKKAILKVYNYREVLKQFNDNILQDVFIYSIDKHSKVVKSIYERLMEKKNI